MSKFAQLQELPNNLYKYLNKGLDRAMMRVNEEEQPEQRNEVKEF